MARVSADVRRELLVEAAIRVMSRDGVAKATTRSIVAEADMALGAFHYCFRSKAELLENVIATIQAHTLDRALEAFRQGGSVEEQLIAGVRTYWQHVLDHPDEHRVTYELTQYAVREPDLADLARKQYDGYLAAFAQVLGTLTETAGVEWSLPLPVLTRYLVGAVDGLTLLYLNEGDAVHAGAALEVAARHAASLATPIG
jgi:AcrR family transcriptional regulator